MRFDDSTNWLVVTHDCVTRCEDGAAAAALAQDWLLLRGMCRGERDIDVQIDDSTRTIRLVRPADGDLLAAYAPDSGGDPGDQSGTWIGDVLVPDAPFVVRHACAAAAVAAPMPAVTPTLTATTAEQTASQNRRWEIEKLLRATPDQVVPRATVLAVVGGNKDTLNAVMQKLRYKHGPCVETIKGVGYIWRSVTPYVRSPYELD